MKIAQIWSKYWKEDHNAITIYIYIYIYMIDRIHKLNIKPSVQAEVELE